jgi:hypothetical protein
LSLTICFKDQQIESIITKFDCCHPNLETRFSHQKEDSQTQNPPLTCAEIVVGFVSDHLLLEQFRTTTTTTINFKKGVS